MSRRKKRLPHGVGDFGISDTTDFGVGTTGVTIDNDTGQVVEPTVDPNIVRERKTPGESMPEWAMAADSEYWYGPTQNALLAGKVIAAIQTVAEVPERIYDAVSDVAEAVADNLPSVAKWAIAALIAYAVIKVSED